MSLALTKRRAVVVGVVAIATVMALGTGANALNRTTPSPKVYCPPNVGGPSALPDGENRGYHKGWRCIPPMTRPSIPKDICLMKPDSPLTDAQIRPCYPCPPYRLMPDGPDGRIFCPPPTTTPKPTTTAPKPPTTIVCPLRPDVVKPEPGRQFPCRPCPPITHLQQQADAKLICPPVTVKPSTTVPKPTTTIKRPPVTIEPPQVTIEPWLINPPAPVTTKSTAVDIGTACVITRDSPNLACEVRR